MRHAFKMYLNPGRRDEYRRRHDAIWPELKALLAQSGISNYSIYLDPETDILFAYFERPDGPWTDALATHPVMRRWWEHMKDIMVAKADASPVTAPLEEMFHLE